MDLILPCSGPFHVQFTPPQSTPLRCTFNNSGIMTWDGTQVTRGSKNVLGSKIPPSVGASLRLLHEAEHVQPHRLALYALKVLNKLAAVVARPLSIVFGKSCLSHGWKKGNITLIFEKGKSREL